MIDLTIDKVKAFTYAVKNQYWYQMYIDGLPIWGEVGKKDDQEEKYYIFTHKRFEIGYNGQQIVDITLHNEKKELLTPGAKIKFSYEVNWKQSSVVFKNRFDKYLDPKFFQHRVSSISFVYYLCLNICLLSNIKLHFNRFTGSVFLIVL